MKAPIALLTLSLVASGAVTRRRAVKFSGAQATVQGEKVAGVAEQDAATGALVAVTAIGEMIVESGAAIAVGDDLIVDAQGRAIPSTGALAIKAGVTDVTSTAANGAGVLQGAALPEFVFARALEVAGAAGVRIRAVSV